MQEFCFETLHGSRSNAVASCILRPKSRCHLQIFFLFIHYVFVSPLIFHFCSILSHEAHLMYHFIFFHLLRSFLFWSILNSGYDVFSPTQNICTTSWGTRRSCCATSFTTKINTRDKTDKLRDRHQFATTRITRSRGDSCAVPVTETKTAAILSNSQQVCRTFRSCGTMPNQLEVAYSAITT